MYRWLGWVVVALLAAFLASGCGGDDDENSATAWADDVCSAITTWKDSITSTADSLKGGNLSEDSLRSAADDVESATSDFVDDVRGLGKPDTDAGEQAKESLDQLADEADQNLSAIKSAVDDASGVSGARRGGHGDQCCPLDHGQPALLDVQRAQATGCRRRAGDGFQRGGLLQDAPVGRLDGQADRERRDPDDGRPGRGCSRQSAAPSADRRK